MTRPTRLRNEAPGGAMGGRGGSCSLDAAVKFTQSTVRDAAPAWLEALGYTMLHGPYISPAGDALRPALSHREREKYSDMVQFVLDAEQARRAG